jgi:hypothetical protein
MGQRVTSGRGFIDTPSMSMSDIEGANRQIEEMRQAIIKLKAAVMTIAVGQYGHHLSKTQIEQIVKDLTE